MLAAPSRANGPGSRHKKPTSVESWVLSLGLQPNVENHVAVAGIAVAASACSAVAAVAAAVATIAVVATVAAVAAAVATVAAVATAFTAVAAAVAARPCARHLHEHGLPEDGGPGLQC